VCLTQPYSGWNQQQHTALPTHLGLLDKHMIKMSYFIEVNELVDAEQASE
jgi:hypothetical protein